jgi:ribose 5-phosphate isomerase B
MRDLVTAEDVFAVPPGGEISVAPGAVITPWASEIASTRGVRVVKGAASSTGTAVALGADHGGFEIKERLKATLTRLGRRFLDLGAFSSDPVDYPDVALLVARAVRAGEARFGILVDGAGIGSAMAANKVPGVRAALCVDAAAARNAREHNDANVLTLGARFLEPERMGEIVETFLSASCTEERHRRRVGKILSIESTYLK